MNNNNINITENDVNRIKIMIVILIFLFPVLSSLLIGLIITSIFTLPLLTTKIFAFPFVSISLLILIIMLIINGFKRKENRFKIWPIFGIFIISVVLACFQCASLKVEKNNLLNEEVEVIEKVLYMDPYKKFFDDEVKENLVEFVVNENLNEYEFFIKVEVPKKLNFKEYYDIGFNDELELDFIELKEYDIKLLIMYYYDILISGLKEGKIYVNNFDNVTRKVIIEGNSETIELIKSKMVIEQYD